MDKNGTNIIYFNRARTWIYDHTVEKPNGKGIAVTSLDSNIYPEVTGYYIPTLLQWGERELALSYADYLCNIQKEDGSWYDSLDKEPYIFDSAQILKGLLAIYPILPEVKNNIIKGCDWILSNMRADGQLVTPSKDAWGEDTTFCSELIHLYCLSPIIHAGKMFGREDYVEKALNIKKYYIENYREAILHFNLLSHFYAYVMEALFDLEELELLQQSLKNLDRYITCNGSLRGLRNVSWVCSTGMFQIALVLYKLSEQKKGDRIFNYALKLQNESGGWFGSYPKSKLLNKLMRGRQKAYYFPNAEISWANKFFLDALFEREKCSFEMQAPVFMNEIDADDGRYLLVKREVENTHNGLVCDAGCGKGRYLARLYSEGVSAQYYAVDISSKVMSFINPEDVPGLVKSEGRLTCMPFQDEIFDLVYCSESFERAINLEGALNELLRTVKKGGTLLIIDKPAEKLGSLKLYEWEQWISEDIMSEQAKKMGINLETVESVPYEGKDDGLFRAWIFRK